MLRWSVHKQIEFDMIIDAEMTLMVLPVIECNMKYIAAHRALMFSLQQLPYVLTGWFAVTLSICGRKVGVCHANYYHYLSVEWVLINIRV